MGRLLSPGNVAVILLILTIWIPSKILPEGTKIQLGFIDNHDNNKEWAELDPSKVEMPDIYHQTLREILDKWDCEIGFWDRSDDVQVVIYNDKKPSSIDTHGNPDFRWAEYDLCITRLKYDEENNTIRLKIKSDNGEYAVKNPREDSNYFENHIRQILARAFMSYSAPIISQKGTASYSWPITGAVVESTLYNDCDVEIEYELKALKGKTPEWKGTVMYEGKNDLLDACDFSFYELTECDKSMHFGDDWQISMFLTP